MKVVDLELIYCLADLLYLFIVLAKTFNEHYIHTVEESCGKKATNISQEYGDMSDTEAIHLIYKTFENHQSIKEISRNLIESAPPTHLFPQNM